MFDFLKSLVMNRDKKGATPLGTSLAIGPLCDTVPNARGEFGYVKSNPIPVFFPMGETDYLSRLRCSCGMPFDYRRVGSFGPGPDGHVVDGFELTCGTGNHEIVLYMDMYHSGPSSLVPKGLAMRED
jgi:hypothetical protein